MQDPDDVRWTRLEPKLNGYLEMPGGDGATVEVELDSRLYLNEDGVERTVVLL